MRRDRIWYVKQARRIAAGLVAILLFTFALEMTKSGASGLVPLLDGHLDIDHAANCLGLVPQFDIDTDCR